jgi:hypothetical protein
VDPLPDPVHGASLDINIFIHVKATSIKILIDIWLENTCVRERVRVRVCVCVVIIIGNKNSFEPQPFLEYSANGVSNQTIQLSCLSGSETIFVL